MFTFTFICMIVHMVCSHECDDHKICLTVYIHLLLFSSAYTFAVAGNDASIISHATGREGKEDDLDTVLYFTMDSPSCDPNADVPTSFMTAKFNYFDDNMDINQKTVCWKAPSKCIMCICLVCH